MCLLPHAVTTSEVRDLRVCLKSADRELKELKDERKEERRGYETKKMARLQQVSELEQPWIGSWKYHYSHTLVKNIIYVLLPSRWSFFGCFKPVVL